MKIFKINCCGECPYYNLKKHKPDGVNCTAHDEGKPQDSFYKDCPLEDYKERPKGKWNGWGECSICGYSKRQGLKPEAANFCSNCGAGMRGKEDG